MIGNALCSYRPSDADARSLIPGSQGYSHSPNMSMELVLTDRNKACWDAMWFVGESMDENQNNDKDRSDGNNTDHGVGYNPYSSNTVNSITSSNINAFTIQDSPNDTSCDYTALAPSMSPGLIDSCVLDGHGQPGAALDAALCGESRFSLNNWDSRYSVFDFDDASCLADSVTIGRYCASESSPEWPICTPSNHSESFYETSFHHDLSVLATSPITATSQPHPFLEYPDLAISPVPSLTSSVSRASSTHDVLHSQTNRAVESSTTPPTQRTRKQAARKFPKSDLRSHEDRILVACRNQGMSYRKIKEAHSFNVSESTLRGRHRALTKHSSLRPRKPLWTRKDIELLKEAIPLFTRQTGKTKVSWKGVSEYIHSRGGSHAFAYTTCRRKWCEVSSEAV
ncbi:hypothetical protein E4U53_003196 [Claviceps sorghi]|nr:hypothetical protein E4U53_003196 [Claviceps sorghi]